MMQFDFFFAGKNAKHSQISWIGVWGCHQLFPGFLIGSCLAQNQGEKIIPSFFPCQNIYKAQ